MKVAGVDSSTQSCKVVVCDAESGAVVDVTRAAHPDGTEVDPEEWWRALSDVAATLADVSAVGVGGQQHGMVVLDEGGRVIRPALLWNDTRSAQAAADLTAELGAEVLARRTGLVPVASFTLTKLRWLRGTKVLTHASGPTRVLGKTDRGRTISCRVWAGNLSGATAATSKPVLVS